MERQIVTVRVPPDTVAQADAIAAELGTTRSKLVAWAVERSVADLTERMKQARADGLILPPGIPWAAKA
jgi:hypothetical protein